MAARENGQTGAARTGLQGLMMELSGEAVSPPIEDVADVICDDPRTLWRHYRHRVRPVVAAARVMESVLAAR